jgi:4-carboxymuconolactone decarboxylase
MVRKRRMKDFSLMGTRLRHVPMTHLLISNIFEHYHISSEKDFEPRRSHFSKVNYIKGRNGQFMSDDVVKRTQETAKKLFGAGVKMDPPYLMWREFDKDLANEFSKFITGNLYSRTVLTLPERQMAACAMLAALRATGELKLHVNAALNVGCDPKKLTEIFFQVATYAGMPAVNEALEVYRDVLKERGEWPLK